MTGGPFPERFEHAALLIVDVQPDFLPRGALAVPDSDAILDPLGVLMESGPFALQVATQDWHPPGHVSFASSHPGVPAFASIELYGHEQTLWPDHCIQGSAGAELHPDLPWNRLAAIIRKGADPLVDSYSGFRNNWDRRGGRPPTGLGGYLRERRITDVFVCGLARDVCVKWTAEDAADQGFSTHVLWNLTRSVDASNDARARTSLERHGVHVIDLEQLDLGTGMDRVS